MKTSASGVDRNTSDVRLAAPTPSRLPSGSSSGLRLRAAPESQTPFPFAGRFRLGGLLARGTTASVYRGWHLGLDQPIAIKVLHEQYWNDSKVEARFLEEARLGASLRGPHVARVLDFGRSERGGPFIVSELLEGVNLRALLNSVGTLSVDYVVLLFAWICEAVESLHAQGIVHGNLTTGNLFLAVERGLGQSLKVMDFGTAVRDVGKRDRGVAALGAPRYLSPEQLQSGTMDTRSDIWSLGIVLYELLTLTTPFAGESADEVAKSITEGTLVPPSRHRPDVSASVDRLVLRCLARPRELRPPSAAELQQAALQLLEPKSAVKGSARGLLLSTRSAREFAEHWFDRLRAAWLADKLAVGAALLAAALFLVLLSALAGAIP